MATVLIIKDYYSFKRLFTAIKGEIIRGIKYPRWERYEMNRLALKRLKLEVIVARPPNSDGFNHALRGL